MLQWYKPRTLILLPLLDPGRRRQVLRVCFVSTPVSFNWKLRIWKPLQSRADGRLSGEMSRRISRSLVSLHALRQKDVSGAGSVMWLGSCHGIWLTLLVPPPLFCVRTFWLRNYAVRQKQPCFLNAIGTRQWFHHLISHFQYRANFQLCSVSISSGNWAHSCFPVEMKWNGQAEKNYSYLERSAISPLPKCLSGSVCLRLSE